MTIISICIIIISIKYIKFCFEEGYFFTMKKINILIAVIILSLSAHLYSCTSVDANMFPDNGKINIMTSLFPQYDFARHIAGDKANVLLLLPPGTESHVFDPRPGDMLNIYNADLFIYTGSYMEPWAGEIIRGISQDNKLLVVDCSTGIEYINESEEHDAHSHGEHALDPHIWLDPTLAMLMVDNILEALCQKDYENAEYYIENANNYKNMLQILDDDIFAAIEEAERDVLVFGGRFAYIYFLKRYNLKYVTVYDSCSANSEPSVRKVNDVANFIKENRIPCIYHEEFANPSLAKAIAKQTNITYELFSTAHNITKTDFGNEVTFIDIMYRNLENIKKGLN